MSTQGCILKWSIQFGSEKQPAQSAETKFSKLINRKWSKCTKFKLFYKVLNAAACGCLDTSNIFSSGAPRTD